MSVVVSGALLVTSYTAVGQRLLPAARLSQVAPVRLDREISRLWDETRAGRAEDEPNGKTREYILKSPGFTVASTYAQYLLPLLGLAIIFIGWIMFGLGVGWGVHGSVIAGTVGE